MRLLSRSACKITCCGNKSVALGQHGQPKTSENPLFPGEKAPLRSTEKKIRERTELQSPSRIPAMNHSFLSLLAITLTALSAMAGDWPAWRGPTGMGQCDDKKLPITWGGKANANVLWKVALPGQEKMAAQDQNQSSPIVVGDRVFITASYWPGKKDPKQIPEHHVACYRATDGQKLWDTAVAPGPWLFGDLRGGYTAPTPAADAERVYVVFGSSVIAALDHAGKLVWRKPITPFKFDVALAASPVLFGETVILQCDEN